MVVADQEGRPHIANPIRFMSEPAVINLETPALNQHHSLIEEASK
jgi:hypothetical protein